MNTANDNVIFGNLVDRWERGDLTELSHNPPTTKNVYDAIVKNFDANLIREGSSIIIYKNVVYAGNTRIRLALERRQKGLSSVDEYNFPVRVGYPESQDEANHYANGSNRARIPTKQQNAFLDTTPLGRWTKRLAQEVGLPRQLLAERIGNILDCAFYAETGSPLEVNMRSNHRLTAMCNSLDISDDDFPVSPALYQKIKSALQGFAELQREAESRDSKGLVVYELVKKMLLLTSGRPSPGFFLVYLTDYLTNTFGSFTSKTPARILQHANTNAEGLYIFGKDFTRKQGNRQVAVASIREMMKTL